MNPTAQATPQTQRHRQENFPVAGWLCPPALRAPILAIYRFAREADDWADEGELDAAQRLAGLGALRALLHDLAAQRAVPPRHAALAQAVAQWQLPLAWLHALLDAFEQDVANPPYPDRAALLAYCGRSANPVGRLLLHLVGVNERQALVESDAICTGLQLINHWQDLGRDAARGRLYLPQAELQRYGLSATQVRSGQDSTALRALLAELTDWACALFDEGAALPRRVPGRLGWELRFVLAGGRRVAEKIRAMDHATLLHRPALSAWDAPRLVWLALRAAR